jgi:predicted type IV restriction endonuclease
MLPEDSTGEGGFPDCALLQDNKKIILFEAKKLSADPMSHLKQLARYSTDIGFKVWIDYKRFRICSFQSI